MSNTATTPTPDANRTARTVASTLICVLAVIGGMSVATGRAPVQIHDQTVSEVAPAKPKPAVKG